MKVLIIDDEEDTRSIASMSLSILGGVDVVEAEGGLEGIAKAEQDRPDVILLDMMMPVMDGIATLGELQKNAMTNDIPVIFLTAKAMSSEIDRLIRMGAIAVLTKPFDPTTLSSQVENILQTRGLKVTPNTVPAGDHNNTIANQSPAPQAPPPAQMSAPPMTAQPHTDLASQYSTGAYTAVPQQGGNNSGHPQQQSQNQNQNQQYQQPPPNYQNQQPNYTGQMNQQQMHSGSKGELTQQQRVLQQSVTSDYVTPNHTKPAVYLRNTQQEFPLSHNDPGQQGQNQGHGYVQNNATHHGQSVSPQNQQSSGQQQVPQSWKNHQQPQPPYDGQQQWAPQPLTSQNFDGPRPYNEQRFQPPPYPVPNQNGAPNHQGSQTNQDYDQRVSGQIEAVQPKRLTLEELHYQQSITDGYPPHQKRNSNNQPGNGASSVAQSGSQQARTSEKNADADPWVAAANANVQSTSAKFVAPKLRVPDAEKAEPAPKVLPAKAKPPVAKPPEEPRQKKFAHPWGPAKAPNWSQGDDDDSSVNEDDSDDS